MLDIAWVDCMGVFSQDALYTLRGHFSEYYPLLDISADAILDFVKLLGNSRYSFFNYRIITQS